MDSTKLNDWMQVVGIFAVVASLVFVGLQMKQDRQIALAGQYQDRSAVAVEVWNGMAQSEYDIRLVGDAAIAHPWWVEIFGDSMTSQEAGAAIISARRSFTVLDNHHYQYELGFYDEDTWQSFLGHLQDFLSRNSVARAMVRNQPGIFRPTFLAVCVQMVDAIEQSE